MMKYVLFFLFLFQVCFLAKAQFYFGENLIPNPSFENSRAYYFLPETFTQNSNEIDSSIDNWYVPNRSTPDFITPKFENGYTIGKPKSGEKMIGLITEWNWYEYIQVKLKEPLKKNTAYRVEFWIARSQNKFNPKIRHEKIVSPNFGMLFHKEIIENDNRVKPIIGMPQVACAPDFLLTRSWTKISKFFVANDNFGYITIGQFEPEPERELPLIESGYVLLDDIKVIEFSQENVFSERIEPQSGEEIILDNVLFVSGDSELLEESYEVLNKLRMFLEKHSQLKIKINGHTDSKGDAAFNKKLSEKRAGAVFLFLVKNKIPAERLSWEGFGETKPIADNSHKKGRQQNRRVEIEIVGNE